ncbi:hypothetical protein BEP19_00935 [Ammoniphilus oxalaticus]|uniref:Uncharacterized protein n=2 Tax=Ammoniphilus oxalaticus TaxID=66863 RepID=A0A419SML4_9BACL|nr:hypothetical protein BEP19_00935 [Ammoniphilus oxalaticus]
MLGKMFSNFFNKLVNKKNKTVRLIVLENGSERMEGLFISVPEAETYAKTKGFESYKVVPQGRVEY